MVVGGLVRRTALAVERQKDQPEHVHGGQKRRDNCDEPQQAMAADERPEQDLVLAEETGQQGHARNRKRADEERPVRDRELALEPAHAAKILLASQCVNHGAGSEEQQRLEECVRVEMKDPGAECADAHRQEHVAELGDGRIREDPLDVRLNQADGSGEDCGRDTDDRDDLESNRRVAVQDGRAADHVHAGRHHRRGVDERRHGRRAFHGVRQPDVERNLRALARGPDKQQQCDDRQRSN